MDDTLHATLAGWGNFYVITGSAAAALTGLQFVVQTLLASEVVRPLVGSVSESGVATFGTPTVVHFSLALVLSAVLSAPWPSVDALRAALLVLGVGSVIYAVIVLQRTRRHRGYEPEAEDWIWHVILPLVSYGSLLGAAWVLDRSSSVALFVIASATLLLLCIG
ncbi:MAG: hypothetical protein HY275_04450, partial [Gemmatimonadetes bacterium]|nr:hypothetical protein [Gemmatimonadota bacterium]